MKTLYLDLFSGISGDMFLGAMLDLGLDESHLREQLALLDVGDYELRIHRSSRSSVEGVKFDVLLNAPQNPPDQNVSSHGGHSHSHGGHSHSHGGHSHSHGGMEDHGHDTEHARDFAQIKELIRSSALSSWVQEKAESVFHRIAVAEGKVHGLPPDEVHFHEVGAVDSIVDILGACIALESMGKPQVRASVVVEGTGFVHCAHGKFPVPTMATLSILGEAGIALTQCDLPYELVTPTGAALLAEFSQSFGLMKGLVAEKVGYGLGGAIFRAVPMCCERCSVRHLMRPPMKGGNLTRSFFFRPIWMTVTQRCWVTSWILLFSTRLWMFSTLPSK